MDDGQSFGTGYFNAKSLISVRLLDRAADTIIGTGFFVRHFTRALAMRDALYARPYYRLIHAEGDGLPGLTIDRFGDTVVVQITTAGMELLTNPLLAALEKYGQKRGMAGLCIGGGEAVAMAVERIA